MGYTLYVAGVRGSRTVCGVEFLEFGGETSCYVLTNGSYALILDCGSGLSNIKEVIKDCKKIDIILTHLHYDHIIGLLDFEVFPKGVRPRVFGTFAKWNMNGHRKAFSTKPYWPVPIEYKELIDVDWGQELDFGLQAEDAIHVKFYGANHPDGCSMLQIAVNDKKIMLMCDYEHGVPILEEMIQPYDYLIYDGMYVDEEYEKYKGYGHSTIEQGILLGKRMAVKQLIFTHHDPKKTDEVLLALEKKAKESFPNTRLARRGDVIVL